MPRAHRFPDIATTVTNSSRLLILLGLLLCPLPATAHICWVYSESQPPKLFLDCAGVSPTTVREEHGHWHCNFPAADTDAWGLNFIGFHRQFIFDFDIFRLSLGTDRLRVWDAAPNDPIPGNDEDYVTAFTHCFTDAGAGCVDDNTQRAAGALCAGCINLPADLVGPSNLGDYANLGAVGARLQFSGWHGSFHCGAAAAGGGACSGDNPCGAYVAGVCDNVGNTWTTTHDPAFWMGHKMLDEVARDWQELKAADVVVVMDVSGSMDDNCPGGTADPGDTPCKLNDAIEAAKLFASLVQDDRPGSVDEHKIGLVTFATTATARLGGVLVGAPGIVTEGGGEETPYESALAAVGAGGATSIGDGITKGLDVLATGSNVHKALLILSDGEENTAPFIQDIRDAGALGTTQVCAIGFGGAFADPDDKLRSLAEDFGGVFLTDQDYSESPILLEKFFVDSFGQIYDDVLSEDPILILPAGKAATASTCVDVCGSDERLTIVLGRDRQQSSCDLRLVVETPSGKLVDLNDPAIEQSHDRSWHFVRIPLPYRGEGAGRWCATGVRPQRIFTHGFTTDAYANFSEGVSLVRREIHRLFPYGVANALYYEDGSITGTSAYATALQAELAAGTIQSVVKAATAVQFNSLLTQSWGLIVFARQMNRQAQAFDSALAGRLCQGQRALITDLWTPTTSANPVLVCAGATPGTPLNWLNVVGDGLLVQGVIPLRNPGYNVLSISLTPATGSGPWIVQALNEAQTGSIIGNGSTCASQTYFISALTRGFGKVRAAAIRPRVGLGDKILASYRMTQLTRPVRNWDAVSATVTLRRPGGVPAEVYPLFDDGTNGDVIPHDDYWEVEIPVAAQTAGPHLLHAEFELTKDGCTIHREVESTVMAQPDPQTCLRTICPPPRPARAGQAVGVLTCAVNLCRPDDLIEVVLSDSRGWLCLQNADGSVVPVGTSYTFQVSVLGHKEGECFLQVGDKRLVVCVPPSAIPGQEDALAYQIRSLRSTTQPVQHCQSAVRVANQATDAPVATVPTVFSLRVQSTAGSSLYQFELTLPQAAPTRLKLYDARGRQVATVLDGDLGAGVHTATWRGTDDRGASLAAGVYYYHLTSGPNETTGSVLVLR